MAEATQRYAVVSGSNKGIGLEICRQLASKGITVVLTARDEQRGIEAIDKLKGFGLNNVIFHQLDVVDPASVSSLADFVKAQFGKIDILVNNAGVLGVKVNVGADLEAIRKGGVQPMTESYDSAKECLETNYYGVKRLTEALFPLLQLSDSARIVNVSSSAGLIKNIPSESIQEQLSNIENLSEEKVDEVAFKFLNDFKEGSLQTEGWPTVLAAYKVSKACLNAYARTLAKKYPAFCISCVCPGVVKTDINFNQGILTVEEGAESPVRLALLPNGSPSGLFYVRSEVSSF